MADDIASASVRIEPDLEGFAEELKAKLEEATGGKGEDVTIGVDVDDDEAKVKLDEIDAKADETGLKHETIKVDVDDSKARAGMTDLQKIMADYHTAVDKIAGEQATAMWDRLGGSIGNVGLDTEGATFDMEALGGVVENVISTADEAFSGLASTAGKVFPQIGNDISTEVTPALEGSGEAAGAAGDSMGAMGPIIAVLIPIVVAFGALAIGIFGFLGAELVGLAGGIVAMGAAFGVAMLGLGAFGLAAMGWLQVLDYGFHAALGQWQQSLIGFVGPILVQISGLFTPILNSLTPLVIGVTQTLGPILSAFTQFLTSPGWLQFMSFLGQQVGPALYMMADVFGQFGDGFSAMWEASAPFIQEAEKGIMAMAQAFAAFGNSSAFQTFMNWLVQVGPGIFNSLIGFVIQFAQGFMNMLEAAAPLMPIFEQGLLDISGAFLKFSTSKTFQDFLTWLVANGPQIAKEFVEIAGSLVKILPPLADIGVLFLKLFTPLIVVTLTVIADALGAIGSVAVTVAQQWDSGFGQLGSDLFNWWEDFDSKVIQPLMKFFTVDAPAWLKIFEAPFILVWNVIKSTVTTIWNVIWQILSAGLDLLQGKWGDAWDHIKQAFSDVWDNIKQVAEAVWNFVYSLISNGIQVLSAIWSFTWGLIKDVFSTIWNDGLKPIFDFIGGAISGIGTVIGWLEGAWSSAWNAMGAAINWVWVNVIQPVVGSIKGAIDDVQNALSTITFGAIPGASGGGGGGGGSFTPTRYANPTGLTNIVAPRVALASVPSSNTTTIGALHLHGVDLSNTPAIQSAVQSALVAHDQRSLAEMEANGVLVGSNA